MGREDGDDGGHAVDRGRGLPLLGNPVHAHRLDLVEALHAVASVFYLEPETRLPLVENRATIPVV